jgi:hypothetical protein
LLPSGITPPRPLDAAEGRKLADTVRTLVAERDRFATRVAGLERGLNDVTGSIARVEKVAEAAQQAAAAATAAPRTTANPPDDVTSSIGSAPTAVPLPLPAPGMSGRGEFGLDLGSAPNIEGLRVLWAAALRRYSTLLEGLRPVVQTRDRGQPGSADLHLIVGPIPNAATAARLCVTITAAGAVCQPATYEGQRLALR